MVLFSCNSKYPLELGKGFKLDYDGNSDLYILNDQNTVMVGSHILEYAFDSTFIIASQRPWDSIPNFRTMNYTESSKAFEQSTFRQYWIVNKKEKSVYSLDTLSKLARYSNVYGPYKKNEYLEKREELGLSIDLKLEDL